MREKPNILFILIDDMGWMDLGCYGSTFYETPNIDRLSKDGLIFTQAYAACPVCSPTRASILTGKYPATVGVTSHIDHTGKNHPLRGKLMEVSYFRELPLTEKTLARALEEKGYRTWHVGKWHLGNRPCYPDRHGFEVNIGGCEFGQPKHGYFSPWNLPVLKGDDVPEGTYLTDYLTDKAMDLIKENKESDDPFFLNLWYYSVHTPIQAKSEKIEKYKAKARDMGLDQSSPFVEGPFFPAENKKDQRICRRTVQSDPVYAAMIESLDENIGRLMALLKELEMEENTIVVFTSDNGGLATGEGSPTCNTPLAEGKGWKYEGGIREPLLVKWPGKIAPGSRTAEPVTSPDFYPTLLEAVGLDLIPEQHCDGESFLPLLQGKSWTRSNPLFWHFPHYGNQGDTPGCAVREGDWKLIEFFEDGMWSCII
jgi:arylsulfatase A-like enzyme